MRAFEKYTFKLVATPLGGGTATEHIVHPSYDALKLKYAKESGEMYFNKSIDTEFTFINEDFVTIMAYPLLTDFELQIMANGTIVANGTFRKTDCEFDVNAMSVKTKVSTNTLYDNLKAKLNDEYDLVKLGIDKKLLNYQIHPMIQYYEFATTNLTSIINGESHFSETAQKFDAPSDLYCFDGNEEMYGNRLMRELAMYVRVSIPQGETGAGLYEALTPPVTYVGDYTYQYKVHSAPNSRYYIMLEVPFDAAESRISNVTVYLIDSSDESIIASTRPMKDYELFLLDELTMTYYGSLSSYGAESKIGALLCRVIGNTFTNASHVPPTWADNDIAYAIGSADPFFHTKAYKNFVLVNWTHQHLYTSTNFSQENTTYGKTPDGTHYYDKPSGNHIFLPVLKECWSNQLSIWVSADEILQQTENTLGYSTITFTTCRDTYSIGDVIKALLNEIDKDIVFEPTEHFSYFLFGGTKTQGDIRITSKTNIMYTGYEYPAWKAPIHLGDVFDLLKNALNCYWYLDGYELHIEHIEYFLNGMSYSIDGRNILRLNERFDPYNGKPQSYRTNNWKYDGGGKQTTRIEFSWMDKTCEIFDDYPIIVPKQYQYAKEEATEMRDVNMFTSDINFIVAISEEVSQDGFAVMITQGQSNDIQEQIIPYGGIALVVQNYALSFRYLIDMYMFYNIPARYCTAHNNNTLISLNGIRRARLRTNDVTFQFNNGEQITPMEIIETEVGNGNVESLELDLATNTASAKLTYELE